MRRDNLELASESLFIEKIENAFCPTEADLLLKVHAFSKERAFGLGSEFFKAAELLLDQEADAITIAGALLAPLSWYGRAGVDEVRKHFGRKLAEVISDLTPPVAVRIDTESNRRKDIRTLLGSLAGAPRKVLILIAIRFFELESALENPKANSRRIAQETIDFYIPIANMLSLGRLCRQLEDVCFRVLNAAAYEALKQKVAPIQTEDDKCLEILTEGLQRMLKKNGIKADIQGRTKSLFSIFSKMNRTGKSLEEIMDRIGLRIIVSSVPECYIILGLLHAHFKPISGTFDDYIGLPKDNGYQSLHTCVYPVREISHKPIEFQIRTELMHVEAEFGKAAHWKYKSQSECAENNRLQAQRMKGLIRQQEDATTSKAFIELLHRQVFESDLVVFGNEGRIMHLSDNSTVGDYLNTANIQVSNGAVIKVNGEIAGLDRHLEDGDSIAIVENGDLSCRKKDSEGLERRIN